MLDRHYSRFESLAQIYLEDSYVLGISESCTDLVFELDVVLCPGHSEYTPAAPEEQHCYRYGHLGISGITWRRWVQRSMKEIWGPFGEVDLGNIDVLTWRDGVYTIAGEWGVIEVASAGEPVFRIGGHDEADG